VEDLLGRLTTEEKIWNMLGDYLHNGVHSHGPWRHVLACRSAFYS
jgi:hypothetical protein